ncbi:MAG: hypothetical protein ACETWM_03545 [Candidatus Lokiarchaeia archaeon]
MSERPPSTNLKIKSGLLRKIHSMVVDHYPNEVAALIVGHRDEGWEIATNLLKIRIFKAKPRYVEYDLGDVFEKMKKFYVIGHLHSHPHRSEWSGSTVASKEDHNSWKEFYNVCLERYGRRPYVFIYAYPPGILNVYKESTPVSYVVVK